MQLMLTLMRTQCKIISSGLVARETYQGNHAWNMTQSFFLLNIMSWVQVTINKEKKDNRTDVVCTGTGTITKEWL